MKNNSFFITTAKIFIFLSVLNIVLINTQYFCHCDEDLLNVSQDGCFTYEHHHNHTDIKSDHSGVHIFFNNSSNSDGLQIILAYDSTVDTDIHDKYYPPLLLCNSFIFKRIEVSNLKFIPLYLDHSSLII